MTSLSLLYVPLPDMQTARTLANTLVMENVVACINLLPSMTSFYKWQGTLQEESEVLLIGKVITSKREYAMAKIAELHPYECPCILTFDVDKVNDQFCTWIATQQST